MAPAVGIRVPQGTCSSFYPFSGAIKRSGLSLDFIDSLLNEFAEEPEEEPLPSNSLLHESSLHGESLTQEPMFNEAHNQESMLANLLAPEKDPMSNVIPGRLM